MSCSVIFKHNFQVKFKRRIEAPATFVTKVKP